MVNFQVKDNKHQVPSSIKGFEVKQVSEDDGLYRLKCSADQADQLQKHLEQQEWVEFAELDVPRRLIW